MNTKKWMAVSLIALNGLWLGLGLYTFRYAKGFSYLSSEPKVCANCHIMQSQYDSWANASHRQVATCVDCHLPQGFLGKYLAKLENGYFHSKAFTSQDFPEPIRITPKNARILQNNCVHCHDAMVREIAPLGGGHEKASDCVHCHASVGHGERAAMGRVDSVKLDIDKEDAKSWGF